MSAKRKREEASGTESERKCDECEEERARDCRSPEFGGSANRVEAARAYRP